MNRHILVLFKIFLIVLLFSFDNSFAQWEPEVRLTFDDGRSWISNNNAKCVDANGDSVYVVWQDNRSGNDEIYFKRSTDRGTTWEPDVLISSLQYPSYQPAIARAKHFIHIVWVDQRDGNDEIYYRGSIDGGLIWEDEKRLVDLPLSSLEPSIAASDSNVHVVYNEEYGVGNGTEIFYLRSTNAGIYWEIVNRLTVSDGPSEAPSVSVSGSTVHVVWYDHRDYSSEIYYKYSEDNGMNWSTDTRITPDDSSNSEAPSIAVSENNLHVVWMDSRDEGTYEIYYKRSTDSGLNWGPDTRLTFTNIENNFNPSIAVYYNVIHVVWYLEPGYEVYYKRSSDGGINWSTVLMLSDDDLATSVFPSITVSGSTVHTVWSDLDDANYEIYYRRNLTGELTDVTNENNNSPDDFILFQNYPNPFNPATSIQFAVGSMQFVTLKIYDILGREVATLVDEEKIAGNYEVTFDGKNLSTGIYFYQFKSGNFRATKKMILIK